MRTRFDGVISKTVRSKASRCLGLCIYLGTGEPYRGSAAADANQVPCSIYLFMEFFFGYAVLRADTVVCNSLRWAQALSAQVVLVNCFLDPRIWPQQRHIFEDGRWKVSERGTVRRDLATLSVCFLSILQDGFEKPLKGHGKSWKTRACSLTRWLNLTDFKSEIKRGAKEKVLY